MHRLLKISPEKNLILNCEFEDGKTKKVDLSYLLKYPVFAPLKNESVFNSVKNKSYFIEWEEYEIDLSADTLWHI